MLACIHMALRMDGSGIIHWGNWQIWLLAVGGTIYFAIASLYVFYDKVAFDFSNLIRLPASRFAVLTHFSAGLSEEILFRGVVLYRLVCALRHSRQGRIKGVVVTSLLFAVLHITQVFTFGISLKAVLILTLETFVISIWWGALVLLGRSVWPAVMLHVVVNAIVAVQGLTTTVVIPDIRAYSLLLGFSIPLGLLGIGLLVRQANQQSVI